MTIIRHPGQCDVQKMFTVLNSNLDDYFAPDVINFFMMQWPKGQLIAVDLFGNVMGVLCGSRLDGSRASISLLAVDSRYRGHGIGSQLIEEFKRSCFMEGRSTVQLEVRTRNTRAISFYQRKGFTITEELPRFYSDGGDGYRMTMDLRRITSS